MKKILSVIVSAVMTLSVITVTPQKAEAAANGKAVVSIEKLTIGQGTFGQPMQVTVNSGDTVKDVIDRYMISNSFNYYYVDSNGWYITSILGADTTKTANIPNEIANIAETFTLTYYGEDGLTHVHTYGAPSTHSNLGNSDTALGEGDYSKMSGWVITVNNKAYLSDAVFNKGDGDTKTDPTVRSLYQSADKISVKNGDVIRVMFTVFGYGADVGIDTFAETGIDTISLADKTSLLQTVADVNAKKSYWMVYPNVKTAYDTAIAVVKSYNPTQSTVNNAVTKLKNAVKAPQNPYVGSVKIKSAKNVKGNKIKITVSKVAGATGYQYRYGNNKKLKNKKKKKKNALSIKRTKITYTTKKIKNIKKKKAYVKVRAYRKVNGNYVYGKWTKVKTVSVKK
jgi:hypothetical protein